MTDVQDNIASDAARERADQERAAEHRHLALRLSKLEDDRLLAWGDLENATARVAQNNEALRVIMGELYSRLQMRELDWVLTGRSQLMTALDDKLTSRPFFKAIGLSLPELYCQAKTVEEIDFGALPPRFVLKPTHLTQSKGVLLIDGERELHSGDKFRREDLSDYVRTRLAQTTWRPGGMDLLVEEMVSDINRLAFPIPRDFKVYVAGERAHYVEVIDRNTGTQALYTPEWARLTGIMSGRYRDGPSAEPPRELKQLIADADCIASFIRCFMRCDFYMTERGPVFGEIHLYPAIDATAQGDDLFCALWDKFPDAEPIQTVIDWAGVNGALGVPQRRK